MVPIFPIVLVGGTVALIALLMSKGGKAEAAEKPKLPELTPEVKNFIDKSESTSDPKQKSTNLLAASMVAKKQGKTDLAIAIKKRADGIKVEHALVTYKSPFTGVSPEAWTRFVNCSRASNPHAVSDSLNMGIFQFGVRRLVDLKIMKNPRQVSQSGKKVWVADWVAPWNLQKFLADTAFQYQLFVASNLDYYKRIKASPIISSSIGKTVDGIKVSLSGLLALAKRAGFAGMQKWLTTPKDRQKFAGTTVEFKKCNGIF